MQHAAGDRDAIAAAKDRLRAAAQQQRRDRPEVEREHARAAIRDHLLRAGRERGWRCVAAYVPLRSEPGSLTLLAGLTAAGIRVLVPITLPDRDLDWAQWTPAGTGTPLGVAAVSAAEAVLVPASRVSRDGTRLGRGGGSYDRVLPRTSPGTPRIALLFDGELVDTVPRDEWDEAVTDAVQPSGWTVLSGGPGPVRLTAAAGRGSRTSGWQS